ncbi:hypothetical protein HY636_00320 [Candidatus Woesearchaeota archaeon]|nr:hypothetical protein [Candidatus Woesearchaeota archaeon]
MSEQNLKKEDIKELVKNSKIKLYELEEYLFQNIFNSDSEYFLQAVEISERLRAEIFEETLGITLDTIKDANYGLFVNNSRLKDGNILKGTELKLGTVKIPLSIAGPVKINWINSINNSTNTANTNVETKFEQREFHIPIATNEAALVAGLNRGIKAINLAGGVVSSVVYNGMTRAPLLEAPDIFSAQKFSENINTGKYNPLFAKIVEENAEYSKFMDVKAFQIQNKVWLRFRYNTGEAMGMNSAVKYTTLIMQELLNAETHPETKDFKLLALSGNLCSDKKAAMINIVEGRGYKAEASIIISNEILEKVFNVSAERIIKLNFWKNHVGSLLAGSLTGCNANAANTIAGIFAATGQDLAQIVESSTCYTFAAPASAPFSNTLGVNNAIKFSITLPCLEIGTIGGGTQFGTAKEAFDIIFANNRNNIVKNSANNCANLNEIEKIEKIEEKSGNNINNTCTNPLTRTFAEVIAAAVLAQELNLLAVLANEYALCNCHMKLARGE